MKQLNANIVIPETAPEGHEIIVIGKYVWGRGLTRTEAIKNLRQANDGKATDYEAHVCPIVKDTSPVNDMGQYYSCSSTKNCPFCK